VSIFARSLWIALGLLAPTHAVAADLRPLVVFDLELINSSLEAERPDETRRLAMLNAMLRERLAALDRFRLVDITPLQPRIAASPQLHSCNGCELDLAREIGAELVATGTVQKVSNLILNMNLVLKDVPTGTVLSGGSVDIRGNVDESWRRGLDRLLRNQGLVATPAGRTGQQ
jgi:hypothetical protein